MAARKRREGCQVCADTYLELARANGAMEEMVTSALLSEDAEANKGMHKGRP